MMKTEKLLENQHAKQGSRYWGKDEDVPFHNFPKSEASCASCQLVKWYPSLLTLSTVMAGVFCWLYVTKPVVVTKTMIPAPEDSASLVVSQDTHERRDLVVKVEDESHREQTLNPELGFLPGEEEPPGPVFANTVPGQGVEIVRVKRSTRPLFQPLADDDLSESEITVANADEAAGLSAGIDALEESIPDQPIDEEENLYDEGSELSGDSMPADASSHWDGEGEEVVREVAISLMGEIVLDSELETKIIASSMDNLDLE